MEYIHSELTNKIIKCYYTVYNTLGYGFLEKVYENAMMVELKNNGLVASKQIPIEVFYDENKVGEYFADILVENKIILELKAAESLALEHELQLVDYLRATSIEVGLLLNFGVKPEIRRKLFLNTSKKIRGHQSDQSYQSSIPSQNNQLSQKR